MTEARGFDWRIVRVVAVILLAIKLVLLVAAHPFMDETYYFVWGRHLQLSYFDHPALVGWTEALGGALFGWTIVGLRATVLLTLVGDLVLLYLFARRSSAPDDWRWTFWMSVTIFLATPILFGLSSVALPDHLLLFFSLAAVYCVERLRHDPQSVRWLYLAALAIALATLSKYTGALLGVALLIYLIQASPLRWWFRSPHLYLAILVAVALQVPVLIWNAQHGAASFGFIVGGHVRPQSGSFAVNPESIRGFLVGGLAVLSPFLLYPLTRFVFAGRDGHGYARMVFLLSTGGFFIASFATNILIHWNAIAYVAALPFLSRFYHSRVLLSAQLLYGTAAIVLAGINYAALPVTAPLGGADQTSAWSYGWDEVGAAVAELKAKEPIGFVAATDYALASPLAFALRDPDVTSISAHRDGYDDWFEPQAHKGQTALIVADTWRPLPGDFAAQFASVEVGRIVDIARYGYRVDHYTIYIARAFAPPSQPTN